MSDRSAIKWTNASWNPVTGCTNLSAGCGHCYASNPPPPHIWLGVSIENATTLSRLRHLKQTNAAVRFLSFEPLLGPVGKVDLMGIHWVIASGESGPGARPMDVDWLREIRDQCQAQSVAFFFKQWGGRSPKSGGNVLDGQKWLGYPAFGYAQFSTTSH